MTWRPIKLTVIGLHYAPEITGNAPYTTGSAEGLHRRGHDVHVITGHPACPGWRFWDGYGQWKLSERLHGVPVTRLRHWVPSRPNSLHRLMSELSFGFRLLFAKWHSQKS